MPALGVVILAAGQGKRMRSARAKVLHTLGGTPLINHVLRAVRTLRPERLVVVVGHQAEEVRRAAVPAGGGGARRRPKGGPGERGMGCGPRPLTSADSRATWSFSWATFPS